MDEGLVFFVCVWAVSFHVGGSGFIFPVRLESSFIFLQCPSRLSPHAYHQGRGVTECIRTSCLSVWNDLVVKSLN